MDPDKKPEDVFRTPYSAHGESMRQSLESDRDQNLPLEACLGELIDNAFEWEAKNVWIDYKAQTSEGFGRAKSLIICDDGLGMDSVKLVDHLTVGFHDARGGDQSTSVSKYGVGAKYAFFNTCRKCEVWSKQKDENWYKAEFDFDDNYLDKTLQEMMEEYTNGNGNGYPKPSTKQNPPQHYHKVWKELDSGTFIQWSSFDKASAQVSGVEQLTWWLESAFRNFIGEKIISSKFSKDRKDVKKIVIENPNIRNIIFNGKKLRAYDSLFTIPCREGDDLEDLMGLEIPESLLIPVDIKDKKWVKRLGGRKTAIAVHFGIAPRSWRTKSGVPFKREDWSALQDVNIKERRVQGDGAKSYSFWDSRSFVSLVRNGREVGKLADHLLVGKRREDTDRWLAMTIEFGPELDDEFNVRNIKYQVFPTQALKKIIRGEIKATIATMHAEVTGFFEKNKNEEKARLAEIERKKNKGGEKIKIPSAPEEWADKNKNTIGDLPDTEESPTEMLDRLFGSLQGFNAGEEIELARRKLTITPDVRTQIPADTERMFEYTTQGSKILQVKFQNHPYYNGLQTRYNDLMNLGNTIMENLDEGELDKEELKKLLNEITVKVKELEIIRDFGMNAAVIALARQNPKGATKTFRDIFLREWGQFCRVMISEHFENDED